MSKFIDQVKIKASAGQGLGVLNERSNGAYNRWTNQKGETTHFSFVGEFCLDELEGGFVHLIANYKPELPKPLELLGDVSDTAMASDILECADIYGRYGATVTQARKYIEENPELVLIDGISESKGGRVWLTKCITLPALQAVIIVMMDQFRIKGYSPTHIEDSIELAAQLRKEQDEEEEMLDLKPEPKSSLSASVEKNYEDRAIARKFIQDMTTKVHLGWDAEAIECFNKAVEQIDEQKDNAYFLIAVVRGAYVISAKLPNYWETFKKVYELLVQSQGEDKAKAICVGLYQKAKSLNVL